MGRRRILTPEQEREIDARYEAGEKITHLAAEFGVHPQVIYRRRYQEKHPERTREADRRRDERNRASKRKRSKEYYRDPANREKYREWARAQAIKRKAADPDFGRRHYWANREDRLEKNRVYREENREAWREKNRRWQDANPDKRADSSQRRRARKAAALVEDVDRLVVWNRDGGICGICGKPADPEDWHLDHVVAIAVGGEHSYANVQVTHPRCNIAKGARPLPPTAAEVQHAFVFDADTSDSRRSSSHRKRPQRTADEDQGSQRAA